MFGRQRDTTADWISDAMMMLERSLSFSNGGFPSSQGVIEYFWKILADEDVLEKVSSYVPPHAAMEVGVSYLSLRHG